MSKNSSLFTKEKILIVDFGSQVTKLIARRIRELKVYCEIVNLKEFKNINNFSNIRGLILSGGPSTVTKKNFPKISKEIFQNNIPVLGICYGLQLIAKIYGGSIKTKQGKREFGKVQIIKKKNSPLFNNFFKNDKSEVWMSHQDVVSKIPKNFINIASTLNSTFTAIQHKRKKVYGLQFHPEVTHTKNGFIIIKNFVEKICRIQKNWLINIEKNKIIKEIKNEIGDKKIICALSGGVDSSVVAILVNKAAKKNLKCIMVDTGLLRKNEFKYSYKLFKNKYKLNIKLINAKRMFYSSLKNVVDPEKKRKIIGKLFIKIFEKESKKIKNVRYLAQGTLYPDVIESKSATGSKTSKIKSHHNVGGLPKKMGLKLIEPLKEIFKDEVRDLGREMGINKNFLNRQPFPGPGLAIRCPGKITKDKLEILKNADHIFIEQIRKYGLYDKIWQAFVAILPVKTVGVMGDKRTYDFACTLRAVTSVDGMTADYYPFEHEFLRDTSTRIINEVKGINRVTYDITSKPPGTIEWE